LPTEGNDWDTGTRVRNKAQSSAPKARWEMELKRRRNK
jgi:hypothetical protein